VHPNLTKWFDCHVRQHLARFKRILTTVEPKGKSDTLLDIGGTGNLLHIYVNILHYASIAMANKWRCDALNPDYLKNYMPPECFRCDYFDAESDTFPYETEAFDTVVCSEVIEHLKYDPAHMLTEIHRVLRKGGRLVLTTPNITSSMALYRMLSGVHPQTWSVYTGKDADRHNREYTPREIVRLLEACGFGKITIKTFSLEPNPIKVKLIAAWISLPWLVRGTLDTWRNRGEYILAVCEKTASCASDIPNGFMATMNSWCRKF
jgi:2-polyprenyl-3-methyl-5-hydroxy-6-metoxy-1,4-benzoquinol methylase